jgi:hypothetical protein
VVRPIFPPMLIDCVCYFVCLASCGCYFVRVVVNP